MSGESVTSIEELAPVNMKSGRSSNECIDDALACELVDDDVIIPLETANPMNNSICVEETKSEPIKKYVHHIISILTES